MHTSNREREREILSFKQPYTFILRKDKTQQTVHVWECEWVSVSNAQQQQQQQQQLQ